MCDGGRIYGLSMSICETFDQHWILNEATGCHEWQRSTSKGYGQLYVPGRPRPAHAHRFAWELAFGVIPEGLHVLHKCDNRKCVNLEHLFLGTNLDNIRDKCRKGRATGPGYSGEAHPMAKLSWEIVRSIRAEYAAGGVSQRALAARYGTQQGHIGGIVRNEIWKGDGQKAVPVQEPKARRVPVRDRFDQLISKDASGCWLWTGALNPGGYGTFRVPGDRRISAHRFMYERTHGPISGGLFVRHICDRRNCVNPEHLTLGTPDDNVWDMIRRCRQRGAVGERNSHAKLTVADVQTIRTLVSQGTKRSALAAQYGISQVQIGNVVRMDHWTSSV